MIFMINPPDFTLILSGLILNPKIEILSRKTLCPYQDSSSQARLLAFF